MTPSSLKSVFASSPALPPVMSRRPKMTLLLPASAVKSAERNVISWEAERLIDAMATRSVTGFPMMQMVW